MKNCKRFRYIVLLMMLAIMLFSCNGCQIVAASAQEASGESESFEYNSIANLWLCGCDAVGDTLTLNLCGVFNDGREADNTAGGGGSDLESSGFCLQVGKEKYTLGTYGEHQTNQSVLELDLGFKVPESVLNSSESCTLLYRGDEAGDYAEMLKFSISNATKAQSTQQAEGISVSAVSTKLQNGYTAVKLYSDCTNGLELVSYGIGGGNDILGAGLNHLGLIDGEQRLCLKAGDETLEALGLKTSWRYPSCFVFETGEASDFTLSLPYVVFKSDETVDVKRSFASVSEFEGYTESIDLKYGSLNLEVQRNDAGELVLCCASVSRSDENLRLCGLNLSFDETTKSTIFRQIANSESPSDNPVISLPISDDAPEGELGFEFQIQDVYYAQIVGLEFPLSTN